MHNILVVYGLRQHPLRSTVEDHLYALRRYARARAFHANLMLGPVPDWMRRIPFDAIIFHTTLLSAIRWAPALAPELGERVAQLRGLGGVRAAMPQDEFLRSEDLCAFIRDERVDVVFSVAPAAEWPKIYADVDRKRVRIEPVLTGYLDDRTLTRIDQILAAVGDRPHDVFYRAGAERAYLGRHGMLKTDIADAGRDAARARGMSVDISVSPSDTLVGDDWFHALAASRWTLGVEGGASILDRDGSVRETTDRFVADHPDATYDEVEAACFPGRDGELALFALSPRHLEACATRTGQILVEGAYSGVLEPGRHYLEVRSDLSNLGDVLDQARDEETRRRLTEAAHRDVVASGRYTYRGFVSQVERVLLTYPPRAAGARARLVLGAAELTDRLRDRLAWRRVARALRGSRRRRLLLFLLRWRRR